MKGVNSILSILAIFGVAFLFYKTYQTPNQGSGFQYAKIGFVKPDTVAEFYEHYQEVVKELEGKRAVMEGELSERSQVFQSQVMEYQKQAPTLSQAVIQRTEQELGALQQRLEAFAQERKNQFLMEKETILKPILDEMEVAVEEVRLNLGLDYVITYDASNFVQSANDDFDISKTVIKQLNDNHSKKIKGEEKSEE